MKFDIPWDVNTGLIPLYHDLLKNYGIIFIYLFLRITKTMYLLTFLLLVVNNIKLAMLVYPIKLIH